VRPVLTKLHPKHHLLVQHEDFIPSSYIFPTASILLTDGDGSGQGYVENRVVHNLR
jgi:hypothetical protein